MIMHIKKKTTTPLILRYIWKTISFNTLQLLSFLHKDETRHLAKEKTDSSHNSEIKSTEDNVIFKPPHVQYFIELKC